MNTLLHPSLRAVALLALTLDGGSVQAAGVTDSPVSRQTAVRAQVIEGANLARPLMADVVEQYHYAGKAEDRPASAAPGRYTAVIQSAKGRIDIAFRKSADPAIAGKTLSLTPYETADLRVFWRCGNHPTPTLPDGSILRPLGTAQGGAAAYAASTVDDVYSSTACAVLEGFMDSPNTREDVIRARVAQGLKLADRAKRAVAEKTGTMDALSAVAKALNAMNGGAGAAGPYVNSVRTDPTSGEITVLFRAKALGVPVGSDTVVFSPNQATMSNNWVSLGAAYGALSPRLSPESLDWACASSTSAYTTTMGLTSLTMGTLPAHYAPPECR
jgi:type IV pilus assembly protein PilA